MNRLLIVQPYIPAYRAALFRALKPRLFEKGIDMRVAAGTPQGVAVMRADDRSQAEADYILNERTLSVAGRTINARRMRRAMVDFVPDMVVVEQAIKNTETWQLVARSSIRLGPSLAMWGQGRSYSESQSRLEASVKQWLTNRCDWFFAYMPEGADYVASHGFPVSRITTLNNTIDTEELKRLLDAVTVSDTEAFRAVHGLAQGRTALFLGGVDAHKGIEFLLASAVEVEKALPGFVLLVGGAGQMAPAVRDLQMAGGPVRYLGRLDGLEKAKALKAADVMMIPEWVGLVAVDSLVSKRPIVATDHSSHSPEYGYLVNGSNSVSSPHTVMAYAEAVAQVLGSQPRLTALKERAGSDSTAIELNAMVDRFVAGVVAWRDRQNGPSA